MTNAYGQNSRREKTMSTYSKLAADEGGVVYGAAEDGVLHYYRDKARDGSSGFGSWVSQEGSPIGTDWGDFTHIMGGCCGIIYTTTAEPLSRTALLGGSPDYMYYYRDKSQDGTGQPGSPGPGISDWFRLVRRGSQAGGQSHRPARNNKQYIASKPQ